MGVDLYLESETGEQLEALPDPHGLVSRLLPDWRDESSVCLRFIDLYGDTVFNRLQIATFIAELESAIHMASDEDARKHGRSILALAEKCKNEVHTYLKFYGD